MATKKNGNQKQPNILIIWGDDIGQYNLSCYTHGLMGYQEFPSVQKPNSFTIDDAMAKMSEAASGANH